MHDSSSPCCFVHHSSFMDELEEFISKHCSTDTSAQETMDNIRKLLLKHFYDRIAMFTPKHLGAAQGFGGFTIFWLHMVIPNSNLSRTQLPKAYFYKTDGHISFLCLDSHLQNYKDAKLRAIASARLQEMIEVLKTH